MRLAFVIITSLVVVGLLTFEVLGFIKDMKQRKAKKKELLEKSVNPSDE